MIIHDPKDGLMLLLQGALVAFAMVLIYALNFIGAGLVLVTVAVIPLFILLIFSRSIFKKTVHRIFEKYWSSSIKDGAKGDPK